MWIAVTSTIITALVSSVVGALVGAVVSKIKTIKAKDEQAAADAQSMMEMQRMNLTMTCRMAIYDEHFTTDEKLDAYVIYRDTCHGNHQTKMHMDQLVGCDVDEYLEKHGI